VRVKGNKVWALSASEFVAVVARNTSVQATLIDLGYKSKNHASSVALRDRIKKENISTAHFCRAKRDKRVIPLDEILVEKSTYTDRQRLRKRLVAEKSFEDKCAVCGLPPLWQGKALTLQLDHANGVPDDNRIKNLRIICPNCHTQTDNFCGRNWQGRSKGEPQYVEKICLFCKKHFTRRAPSRSKYCSQTCAHMTIRKVTWPSADKLQQLVTKYPVIEIAKQYGVDSHTVARWCRQAGIVPPGRGYWAKIRAGIDPNAEPAKCLICGKPAPTGKKKYCSYACADQALRKPMPTAEEIVKLLASMPINQAAKQLGASYTLVHKWCAKLGVKCN
jgi:hypothetical protein